jgi:ribosomal protein S8
MKVEKDFEDFIKLLNYHEAKYLVVGAYALIYYTLPRNTGDIDFFIEASEVNSQKIINVLNDFGFSGMDFKEKDFTGPDMVIQLGYSPNRIDIITGISGISFSEAYKKRMKGKIGAEDVYFISASDLLKNKKAAGRAKDIADAELLEKFLK